MVVWTCRSMDKGTYLYFFVIMVIKNNNAYRKNVIDALYSSVEASLHCHHQLTFSVGENCTPVITKVNIHMTSTSQ